MKSEDTPREYTENFIRAAQYIVRLTPAQDVPEELGKIIVSYFGAEWVAFVRMEQTGEILLSGCFPPGIDLCADLLTGKTGARIRDVFESGFMATDSIALPAPHEIIFLPLTEQSRTAAVMMVAHKADSGAATAGLLNLYLALVGLAGSTMGRIATEQELRRHQGRLEALVEERTHSLSASNEKLEEEIVERVRAEQALKESEQRWATTLSSIGDAVIATDREGRIGFMNAVAEDLTGWSLEEAAGQPVTGVFDIINEQTRMKVESPVHRVFREGTIVGLANHTQLIRKDGTEVPIDDSGAPIKDGQGRIAGAVLVFRDVTERRAAEEVLRKAHDELEARVKERTGELTRAYEELKRETAQRENLETQLRQAQKMEALGTLSGGIAHDFNNILAAIIGFTELVTPHAADGSRDALHLKRIMEASLRGRELVKQMLTFSRKAEQEKKPLRLSAIVSETVRLIRATTPSTISIRVNSPREPGSILGDATQMQQVLMNLCTNAAHAMRERGGVLDIGLSDFTLSGDDRDPGGMEPGPYVRLTVSDTGAGIPAGAIEKIFDPFFTTKKIGEGTGLGLSVVHGIVKQSGGHITVESVPEKGSTFTVYFPRFSDEQKAEAQGENGIPTGAERILFVDDEELLAEMGEEVLAELGYDVTCLTSSVSALSLLEEDPSRFDLVITDQTMPEMTGIELARKVLALRPDMPIIMCTGFSHMVDADAAREVGIRAFAMKPLTKREIAGAVRNALDG